MTKLREVIRQLRVAGFNNTVWGWSEIKRLPSVLEADEKIEHAVSGFYDGGHALIVATDKRIIFLDAKIMSLRVEDIHYEMVSEVEHFIGIISGKLRIHCLSKKVDISSVSHSNIRNFALYVDGKVNGIRLNMRTWEQMMGEQSALNVHETHRTLGQASGVFAQRSSGAIYKE